MPTSRSAGMTTSSSAAASERGETPDQVRLMVPSATPVLPESEVSLFALLKLTSDSGNTGVAEGTIKRTWSGVSPRSLAAALEDVVMPALRDVGIAYDSA